MEPVAGGTLLGVKPFVLAVLVSLLLAGSARADVPSGFTRGAKLEAAASFVAGKPVTVWCAVDYTGWQAFNGGGEANGIAKPGTTTLYLSPDACMYLRNKQRGRTVPLYSLGASILALTHEAIHLRGESDEGKTDCAASHEMVAVAQRFFGVKKRVTLRAMMAQVARFRSGETAPYRSVC